MNALVKKEIRLLLPTFLIGCVLTLSNWLLLWENHDTFSSMLSFIPEVGCPAVAVMIALNSFGVEISSGTFTNLLAQPVSRLKIWETKISLLAVALLVVGVLWFGSIFCVRFFFSSSPDDFKDLGDAFVAGVMFALVVFSGGLWTVLLLRQMAAAFWFTLLVPGVLLMIVTTFFIDGDRNFFEGMIISVLGLYSLAGFFFARWLFLRAQDVQWSGGTIAMPEMRGLPAWLAKSSVKRIFRPRPALWRKEFQLHQSQFVMAFALLVLHLGVIALRTFGHFQKNSSTEFILEVFWGLWFVMPVLVGCAAVAEERKLGTLEGQLCLPVKRRTQFAIKIFVALFLSVLLGAVMPLLLEGPRVLPNVHLDLAELKAGLIVKAGLSQSLSTGELLYSRCLDELNASLPLLTLACIAAAFGLISFYVSSLARNTLQTLAPAVLGILLAFFGVMGVAEMREFDLEFLWKGPLPYFIGVPAMLLTLVVLAFWNFQNVWTGGKMWRRNFFAFALALVFSVATTSAIYHRAWEKLTPFEPPHGAARLSQVNPVSMTAQGGGISVRLPDGKIWMGYFTSELNDFNPIARLLGNFKVAMADGKFINGSNWLTVQYCQQELIGLKTDGSLWLSEGQPKRNFQNGNWTINRDKMQQLVPFGNETNWNSFATVYTSALLVKNDGTLWRWGATNWNWKKAWPGLRTFTPYRLGTESNWAEVFLSDYHQPWFRKTDGSVWTTLAYYKENTNQTIEIEQGISFGRVTNLENRVWRSTADIHHGMECSVAVGSDGTFRIYSATEFNKNQRNYEQVAVDLQIGGETNWLAVAGYADKIVTLKKDGSLWLWDFHLDRMSDWNNEYYNHELVNKMPVQLGMHSDWIAITGNSSGITSLAADGSLWYWPLERLDNYGKGDDSHFEPLLDISRKPQSLGNIFGKVDLK